MKNPFKHAVDSLLHNRRHFVFAIFRRIPWIIPNDELYLKVYYRLSMRKPLNLENPTTFNEKLQWLKLYNRRPEYVQLVDKFLVKEYVANKIGDEFVIPTIRSWESPKDIDWDMLPNQFVLKTNHDGGGNGIVVCRDKSTLNKQKALRELNHSFRRNTFLIGREWPYKKVEKRVFAEKYIEDSKLNDLRDYKFLCFNGVPKLLYIATERNKAERVKFNFFDMDFNHLDIRNGHPMGEEQLEKPSTFEQMKSIAAILSKGIPQVRIDFYEVDGHLYFGEFTFFHLGGTGSFQPEEWDTILGSWIELPKEIRQ